MSWILHMFFCMVCSSFREDPMICTFSCTCSWMEKRDSPQKLFTSSRMFHVESAGQGTNLSICSFSRKRMYLFWSAILGHTQLNIQCFCSAETDGKASRQSGERLGHDCQRGSWATKEWSLNGSSTKGHVCYFQYLQWYRGYLDTQWSLGFLQYGSWV